MPSFSGGFGFGGSRRATFLPLAPSVASLSPGDLWTGTAGSGFGGALPVDPVRITAKPACRLVVPPDQFFTDRLVVGVAAYALNGTTLVNGIEAVRFHYEGRTLDVGLPTHRTFTRHDGSTYRCLGYWVELVHTGTSGNCNLYIEAVPTDKTMQNRVIGPFRFYPQRYSDGAGGFTPHDFRVEVNSTKTPVAGSIYASLSTAVNFLRTSSARNPLITFTHAADNIDVWPGFDYTPDGRLTIVSTVPITFGRPNFASRGEIRPRWPICLRGANITLDMAHTSQVIQPAGGVRNHWLDGIRIIDSKGRDAYWEGGGVRPVQFTIGGSPWFTECLVEEMYEPARSANLTRACIFRNVVGDVLSFNRLSVGNIVDDSDSTFWDTPIASLQVTYTGPAATATIAGTGTSASKSITLRENGTSIGTFAVTSTGSAFTAGTNYSVQNVASWINTFPGWSATVLDNTRVAAALSDAAGRGQAFPQTNCKDVAATLFTSFDLHADTIAGNGDNRIFADNLGLKLVGQNIILGGGAVQDFILVNNAFVNKEQAGWDVALSQMANAAFSHLVIAHTSMPNQRLGTRANATFDGYCAILCNTARTLSREESGTSLKIQRNHTQDDSTEPFGSTEHTIGGTRASLFVDALNGTLVPAGSLLASSRSRAAAYDMNGQLRGANAPAGAVA